jgi:hypothetical protein
VRAIARLAVAGCLLSTRLGGAPALAQSPHPDSTRAAPVLEVPYLAQSFLLCGGAALAMVERWWGRRGVFAEDFAGLVRPEQGGILTTGLDSAARARGWDTRVHRGTPELVRQHLDAGEPVVALIQVSPSRYHYVVVIGWQEGKVTFHDPASAPFITLDENRFLTRWTGADRWAMVVRPMPALPAKAAAGITEHGSIDSLPCRPWLDQAVDAAQERRLTEAVRLLEEAGRSCPGEPLVVREMAGVRFKQGMHSAAIRLAEEYLAAAPEDQAGWQLLAASRYLAGDRDGALAAWNELGRPTVDLLRIDGSRNVRYREIADAASLAPGTVLTPSRLALSQRRVMNVPALRRGVVEYQPVPGGIAEVRVAIVERRVVDPFWRLLVAGAIGAVAQREVGLEVASPTGGGELWTASWRWASIRPRAAFRVSTPGHLLFPGVIGIEGSWDRFNTTGVEETRRSGFVGFGGWLTAGIRPSGGLRIERWSGQRDYLAVSVGAELRALGDRLALKATGERALALSAHRSFSRGSANATWASGTGLLRAAWSTRVGIDWASRNAPRGAWPVAGGGVSWAVPLRAHPLEGESLVAGRGILHAGLAGDHPIARLGPVAVAAGGFLDAVRAVASNGDGSPNKWFLDGGFGLRFGLAEGQLGVIRVDLARGLTGDHRSALTIGIHPRWPRFELSP